MRAFIVHAHPEPQSFNGALTRVAAETLASSGHEVVISDLYAMGFGGKWYDNGVFAGKRAMCSITIDAPPSLYSPNGLNGALAQSSSGAIATACLAFTPRHRSAIRN